MTEDMPVFSGELKCICIRIEQHPRITHLYISRVPSWYIMDGGDGAGNSRCN